jgi:hypothetical protein
MSGQTRERSVRDEIVKSTMSGVGVTALAVVVFSSAGFGGMIGTSQASGAGALPAPEDDPYVSLPAYPQPLTSEEIDGIRSRLSTTTALLEITRAATDDRIERVRALASIDGLTTSVALPQAPSHELLLTRIADDDLRPTLPVEPVGSSATVVETQTDGQLNVTGGGLERDPHLEFAALLLGDEFQY